MNILREQQEAKQARYQHDVKAARLGLISSFEIAMPDGNENLPDLGVCSETVAKGLILALGRARGKVAMGPREVLADQRNERVREKLRRAVSVKELVEAENIDTTEVMKKLAPQAEDSSRPAGGGSGGGGSSSSYTNDNEADVSDREMRKLQLPRPPVPRAPLSRNNGINIDDVNRRIAEAKTRQGLNPMQARFLAKRAVENGEFSPMMLKKSLSLNDMAGYLEPIAAATRNSSSTGSEAPRAMARKHSTGDQGAAMTGSSNVNGRKQPIKLDDLLARVDDRLRPRWDIDRSLQKWQESSS